MCGALAMLGEALTFRAPVPLPELLPAHLRWLSALTSFITLTCNFVLEWCDKIKLSNLLLPQKGGTIKSLAIRTRLAVRHQGSPG